MQKKANFKKAEMFVNYYLQKDYENEPRRRLCENKPKQTQFSDDRSQKPAPSASSHLRRSFGGRVLT